MNAHGGEADGFKRWLERDGLYGRLHPFSHAFVALPTEQSTIDMLNKGVRATKGAWYRRQDWPDDDWIVGERGNGDYYMISRTGCYSGVWQYDHESAEKKQVAPSLEAFYNYCISIEREAGNIAT